MNHQPDTRLGTVEDPKYRVYLTCGQGGGGVYGNGKTPADALTNAKRAKRNTYPSDRVVSGHIVNLETGYDEELVVDKGRVITPKRLEELAQHEGRALMQVEMTELLYTYEQHQKAKDLLRAFLDYHEAEDEKHGSGDLLPVWAIMPDAKKMVG